MLNPQIIYKCLNINPLIKKILDLNYIKSKTTVSLIAKSCLLQDNVPSGLIVRKI